MGTILDLGKEHLNGVLDGNRDSLRELFRARVLGWGKTFAQEEETTVGLFSDFDEEIETHVAFKLMEEAVSLALAQEGFDWFNCSLDLICSLAVASATTEIPAALRTRITELEARAVTLGAEPLASISCLRKHYRNAL